MGDLANTSRFLRFTNAWKIEPKYCEGKQGGEKNIGKQNKKLQQRDVEITGVENNFSFCISIFLCTQPIRSVANLAACVWHVTRPLKVSLRSHSSPCYMSILEEGILCFWHDFERSQSRRFEEGQRFKTVAVPKMTELWLLFPELKLNHVQLNCLLLLSVAWIHH